MTSDASGLADSDALGEAHQFGQRVHQHFFHHSRPMDLDGLFDNAQLKESMRKLKASAEARDKELKRHGEVLDRHTGLKR